jgi:sulfhydrogenase subunit gamma (sulfur reductase)
MQVETSPAISRNIYCPTSMQIAEIREEAPDVRTFRMNFLEDTERVRFFRHYHVGQFGLFGLPGAGESTFCIASPPTRTEYVECTFRRNGRVTTALQDREAGQKVTLRGPYGNFFPVEEWRGKNIVFVAGGIALPPVRSVIWNVLDRRDEFGEVTIVYGAKSEAELVYKDELAQWSSRADVRTVLTVDPGGQGPDWKGKVGFVPTVLKETPISSTNSVAVVCGPPVMIKFTLPVFREKGFAQDHVFTTLENRMKCGIGKCGRCNCGPVYVCKDGPVFTAAQMKQLPPEF